MDVKAEITELPLLPRKRYYYRMQAWNQRDECSPWSKAAFWETGLMDSRGWCARWIAAPISSLPNDSERCPSFRKAFPVNRAVRFARLYATALGLYEISLNGQRAGDAYFTPGWTSYRRHIQYQSYDVTDLLQSGENVIPRRARKRLVSRGTGRKREEAALWRSIGSAGPAPCPSNTLLYLKTS